MVEPMVWHYLSDFRLPIGNHNAQKTTQFAVYLYTPHNITRNFTLKFYMSTLQIFGTSIQKSSQTSGLQVLSKELQERMPTPQTLPIT